MSPAPTLLSAFRRPSPKLIRDPRNPVLPPDPDSVVECGCCMNPFVLRRDDHYWLYYAGADADGRRRICLATAPLNDPGEWIRHGAVLDCGAPDSFDHRWVVLPHVVQVDGRWHLYYTGNSGRGPGLSAFPGIGLATSDDGLRFTRRKEGPVLAPGGQPGDPDRYGIAGGSVLWVADAAGGGEWRFYYTGCPSLGDTVFLDQQKICCLAVSSDGVHWRKRGAVMLKIPARDYVDVAAAGPVVWREPEGLYRMLYSAIGTRWGYYSICYAESDDGIAWRRGEAYGDDLVLTPAGDGWEQQMVEYPSLDRDGDRWQVFYCGNGYGTTGIGRAMSS